MVVENIFENRPPARAELAAHGANIRLNGTPPWLRAVPQLSGAPVKGTDLPASPRPWSWAGLWRPKAPTRLCRPLLPSIGATSTSEGKLKHVSAPRSRALNPEHRRG